jgi:hypothetical protein
MSGLPGNEFLRDQQATYASPVRPSGTVCYLRQRHSLDVVSQQSDRMV